MKIVKILFCIALFCQNVKAQDSLHFLSATTGAACYQVEYYNNYLFAGTGSTLRVYDASGNPPYTMLFEHRFRSIILDLKVKDNFLYVAANHDGISKWDISNMSSLQKLYEYIPDSLNEAANDIAFYGDTLFVAYYKKVGVFYDNGTSFQKLITFGHITGNGYIAGGDLKDSIYAYTVGRNGYSGQAPDGIYFRNARTFAPVSFYQQTFAAPEDVVFGKNTPLLHVMGGSQTTYNGLDPRGYYYSLNISNIYSPQLVFSDTLEGLCFFNLCPSVANAVNAVNKNDTIYVATTAALGHDWTFPDPLFGQVYVYDATNPSDIHYLTSIYAGLWHFDLDIHNNNLYVASEWYGIETLDISNIFNEVDLGNTQTGGWCMKGDKYSNTLILGNEGYGIKKYDISNPFQPVLTGVATYTGSAPGFCQDVKFSADGNYIYGLFQTHKQFCVFDAATLSLVGSIQYINGVGYGKTNMKVFGNKVYINTEAGANDTLKVINVSNPAAPFMDTTLQVKVNDMKINNNGKLFICNNDGIFIYDVNSGIPVLQASHLLSGLQDGSKMAVINDTLFVYVTWKGLVRYIFDSNLSTITEDATVSLGTLGVPQAMDADQFGLYIGFTKYGLYAYNKQTMTQTSGYRTGLDLKGYTDVWPLTDLFCKDNLIFINEYFGQSTILTMDSNYVTSNNNIAGFSLSPGLLVYPNPSAGNFKLVINNEQPTKYYKLKIFDIFGKIVFEKTLLSKYETINLDVPGGIYFLQVQGDNFIQTKKLEVVN